MSVKRLQGALLRAEERIKKKLDSAKDPGITFEATGIDYLFIDEAHGYKNLRTPSNIPDAAIDGSMRASDLDMKISYLAGRNGRRVVTFATATPIANSITEAYVMQHYLRPDLLESAGITDFDTWAATFGETVDQIEMAPEGGSSFRQKTRFARFTNVPEMLRRWHVSADIKTGEDLKLPVPALAQRPADGQRAPETVISQPSDGQLDVMAELGDRADAIRKREVMPEEDNMLKVCMDGRKAALDLRLLGRPMTVPGKIGTAAGRITDLWHAHRDDVYPGPDGQAAPVRGSLQLVFCDIGTPGDGWNVYDELRDQLTARGMPRDAIRFVHDAKTDRDKGELFAACRAGTVAVLIGSTEKMGVGTNVQFRAIALHHLDCPWRPADVAQREGRILRQGNHNDEVQILRYVTERSFDGYMWQTVERKARFIAQVMRGRLDVREIEDIGDAALSYSEVKALATGNPLLMDKAEADAELTRLERAERAWLRNHDALRQKVAANLRRVAELEALTGQIDTAISRRRNTRGDAFSMTLGTTRLTKRNDAGEQLKNLIAALHEALMKSSHRQLGERPGQLGRLRRHRRHGTRPGHHQRHHRPRRRARRRTADGTRRHPGARPRQAHRPARRPPGGPGIPQDPDPHRHRPADHRSRPRPRRPGQALHPGQPARSRTRARPGDRREAQARSGTAAPGRGLGSQDAPEPGRPRLAGRRSDARRRGHGRDDARLLGRRAHPSRAVAGARRSCAPRLPRNQPAGSTSTRRITCTATARTARPGSPSRPVRLPYDCGSTWDNSSNEVAGGPHQPRRCAHTGGRSERLADEKDGSVQGAVARRLCGDLHRAELPGVDSGRHREGGRSGVAHDERAAGGHLRVELGAAGSGPPAHINVVAGEWLEAVHGQLEGPAFASLAGRCLPGGVADAEDLGRSGGMERDDHGYFGRSPAEAERNDDSGGDDGSGDGSYGRQAARVTPPHRQGSDCRPGLRFGRCGPVGGRLAEPEPRPRPEPEAGESAGPGSRAQPEAGARVPGRPGWRLGPRRQSGDRSWRAGRPGQRPLRRPSGLRGRLAARHAAEGC